MSQQGGYWMPCGAIAAKPPTSLEDQRYWSLCRQEELLSSEAECKEAAQQFKEEWQARLKSGFEETEGAMSALKYSMLWHPNRHLNMMEYGAEPKFRHSSVESEKPIGCYMDRNQNIIYWNKYKQDAPDEWTVGAAYTELGGLIQSSDTKTGAFPGLVGICKSPEEVEMLPYDVSSFL